MSASAKFSLRKFWRDLQGPYGALRQYLKPYWPRFFIGMLCGAGFGFVNGSLPWVIQQVSSIIFYSRVDNPYLARFVKNGLPQTDLVLCACFSIPVVMIVRGVLSFGNSYLVDWVSGRVLMDL